MYKQLLGDHRKITDKYKSAKKDLAFAKSKYLSSRIIFVSEMSYLGSYLLLRAGEAKRQLDKVLKELEAVKCKFLHLVSDSTGVMCFGFLTDSFAHLRKKSWRRFTPPL